MAKLLTQNLWRHHQPVAPDIKYGCKPNGRVFVELREELTQGVRPFDLAVTAEYNSQMGYICDYVIDIDVKFGQLLHNEDGRGFWYVPEKDFQGEDIISYRIINVMNQVSEPGCITFIVNPAQKPERIIEIPILAKTTLLQDGDADFFVEPNDDRKVEKDRTVWAYNLIPGTYVLSLSGTWSAAWIYARNSWQEWWSQSSGSVGPIVLGTYTFEDEADFRVIKFTEKIDYETLGLPNGWPYFTPKGFAYQRTKFEVGFVLTPVGDTRVKAESSNRLLLVDATYDSVERSISVPVQARLTGGSGGVSNTAWGIRRGVMLVNGLDSVVFARTVKVGGKVSLGGITYDESVTDVTQVDVQNLSVHDQWSPDSASSNQLKFYDVLGIEKTAVVANLMLTVSNITREKGNVALVAHVTELKAILKVPGWEPKFLGQDATKYIETSEYGGFVILEVFNTESTGTVPTNSISIRRGFSANVEWMAQQESCLNEFGDLDFYPIDLTKLKGLMAVTLSGDGYTENESFVSSPFIPFVSNVTSHVYTDMVKNTYDTLYRGDGTTTNPPSIYLPQNLTLFNRTMVQAPDAVISMLRSGNDKYKLRWRAIPAKTFTNGSMTQEEVLAAVRLHKTEHGLKQLNDRMLRGSNYRVVYEHMFDETVRNEDTFQEVYPEVISIRELLKRENYEKTEPDGFFETMLMVIDFDRNGATKNPGVVEVSVLNSMNGFGVYNSSIVFDNPADSYTFVVGYVHKTSGTIGFIESFATILD